MLSKHRVIVILFFVIATILFIYPVIGSDFGWHLRVGEFIVQNNEVPKTDFLSFSMEGYPYVYHSWLTSVGIYIAHVIAGLWGVSIFFAILLAVGLFISVKTTEIPGKAPLLGALILSPIVLVMIGVRTQIVTYVLLTILLFVIVRITKRLTDPFSTFFKDYKTWSIPVIYTIWSNLHGGFVLGLALLVVFLILQGIFEYFDSQDIHSLKIYALNSLVLIVLASAATGLNPYGFSQLTQAFNMLTNSTALDTNLDWAPLFSQNSKVLHNYAKDILLTVLVVLGILANRKEGDLKQKTLLLLIFYAVCFFTTRFSVIIFVVVSPTLIRLATFLIKKARFSIYPGLFGIGFAVLVTFGIASTHILQAFCAHTSPQCYAELSRSTDYSPYYPYNAVEYMQQHGVPERLLNNFNHGGYLHYYFPNQKFFIDGRMDNFFIDNKSFVEVYFDIINTEEGWEEKFAQYSFDGYLGRKEWELTNTLLSKGWANVNEDDVNVLLLPPTD